MKASIITIFDNNNYGSMLQTYATKTLLSKYGVETEFVDYIRPHMTDEAKIEQRLRSSKYKNPFILWLIRLQKKSTLKAEKKVLRAFLNENVNLSPVTYHSFEELCQNPPDADFYCTGSDQTWNSFWNQGVDRSFFLEFAPEGKPRIALSSSMGKTDMADSEKDEMVKLLKRYQYITVREKSAEELLRSNGIEAHTILDPTLLLTKQDWEKLASPRMVSEPYILVYKLHKRHKNVCFDDYIECLKKATGMKVVRLCFQKQECGHADEDFVLPKVVEFLSLIQYATIVISDSFHATSFSINLHTNFEVILPDAFTTRIENILEITDLKKSIVKSMNQATESKETNYIEVEKYLNKARELSIHEVEKALINAGVKGIAV